MTFAHVFAPFEISDAPCKSDRSVFSHNPTAQLPLPFVRHPTTQLEEHQFLLAHFVRLLVQGHSSAFLWPGREVKVSRTRSTRPLLAEGIKPVLLNSHATPLALYRVLSKNRKAVVWLDDADSIFTSMVVLGILRSALWGQGSRIITYNSSQLANLPPSFIFEGRIIVCVNRFPAKNPAFDALVGRCDKFTLTVSREALFEQMKHMAARGHGQLTPDQCLEAVSFIEQNIGTRQLSMRLYELALNKVQYALRAGINWKDLLLCQMTQLGDDQCVAGDRTARELDYDAIYAAIAAFPDNVKAQEANWCEQRGKSRASF